MTSPRNDCGDCLAFEPDDGGATGRCRRYAPVPVAGKIRAVWPAVSAEDWCLEHRQAEPPFALTFVPPAEPGKEGA